MVTAADASKQLAFFSFTYKLVTAQKNKDGDKFGKKSITTQPLPPPFFFTNYLRTGGALGTGFTICLCSLRSTIITAGAMCISRPTPTESVFLVLVVRTSEPLFKETYVYSL